MKFDLTRNDDQTARLTMVIEKADYEQKLADNLKNYSKKLNVKGFRAGKTPKSVLTKMYGKGMLEETVVTMLNDSLYKHIEDEGLDIFGSPLMAEDAEPQDFNPKDPTDYTFSFDLGLKPSLEIDFKYDTPLEIMSVAPDSEAMENEIARYRRMFGETEPIEDGTVEAHDRVMVTLTSKDEGGKSSEYLVDLDRVRGDAQTQLPGLKKGDKQQIDLEKFLGFARPFILKNVLELEDGQDPEGPLEYEMEVVSIARPQSAELTTEQLQKNVGPQIENEQSFREMLEGRERNGNQARTNDMKKMAVRAALLKANPFEIPELFLLKWVNSQRDKKLEEGTREANNFFRDAKWSFLLNKIAKDESLEVTEQDTQKQVINWITENVNYMQTDVRKLMKELYANEYFMSSMKENALEDVVFNHIMPQYQFTEIEVSAEKFEKGFHDLHHELFDHGDHHDHAHDHAHDHDHDHHDHVH